jgi:RNA polymerase sigma factor (TIGR02999 family)
MPPVPCEADSEPEAVRLRRTRAAAPPKTAANRRLIPFGKRKLAAAKLAQEKPGQTLQATALVHDAYLRLIDQTAPQWWDNRRHFFAAAAEAMRRILVERARQKRSLKRGGDQQRVELADIEPAILPLACDDPLGLDDAL